MQKNMIIFIITILFTLLWACNPPSTDEPRETTVLLPVPPEAVQVVIDGTAITISWSSVPGAELYHVYKRLEGEVFPAAAFTSTGETIYTYTETIVNRDIFFAVKSEIAGDLSTLSVTSNVVQITDCTTLQASQPVIRSFSGIGEITVSWEGIPGVDSYILFRDEDPLKETFDHIVYSGPELAYTDSGLFYKQFYYYRLAYEKAGVRGDQSLYAAGMTGSRREDLFEYNNSPSEPALLTPGSKVICNSYYYRDAPGNIIADDDWFAVEVPAGMEIPVILQDYTGENLTYNNFSFHLEGELPVPVVDGFGVYLSHNFPAAQYIKFRVFLNQENGINKFGSYSLVVEE